MKGECENSLRGKQDRAAPTVGSLAPLFAGRGLG
jgi:hypothetical protein